MTQQQADALRAVIAARPSLFVRQGAVVAGYGQPGVEACKKTMNQ